MCKNFLSLDISLEIGFFIRRNSNLSNFTTASTLYINRFVDGLSVSFNGTAKTIFSWTPTDNQWGYPFFEISVTYGSITDSLTLNEPDPVGLSFLIDNEAYSSAINLTYTRDGGQVVCSTMCWWTPSSTYKITINTSTRTNHTRTYVGYTIRGYLFSHYPFQ